MYKLSVPIMSATVNAETRETYDRLCREAGVARIFLSIDSIMAPILPSLYENVTFFKSRGYEVGIWTDTIGHGSILQHVQTEDVPADFRPMVNLEGEERLHANCPTDPRFRAYISERIATLAQTGVDFVQLDDDFRMSQHGDSPCCACPEHLRRIGETVGRQVSLAEVREAVLFGKPNPVRDAWMTAQREGLEELAREIRAAVDRVAPQVTVCLCTPPCAMSLDGTDLPRLARILAGNNPPLLRMSGAPYWAAKTRRRYPLTGTFDYARMTASFMEGEGIELMSEGDVYPRPRYTCPASYLELFDGVMIADGGYDGILKYMFDYVGRPELELGYLRLHNTNRILREAIANHFRGGANVGVRIVAYPHLDRYADRELTKQHYTAVPMDAILLGSCGIPTVWRGKGLCNAVFGDNARLCERSLLREGTVLDAVSAMILSERGVDVGLAESGGLSEVDLTFLHDSDPQFKSYISGGKVRFLKDALLREGAEPVLFSNGKTVAYRYENADGARFLVFLFEGDSMRDDKVQTAMSGLMQNEPTRRMLHRVLPWLSRAPLPVTCAENPNLYLMCRREEDSLCVAMFNCFADPLTNPVLELDETYRRAECVGCDARLEGNRLVLSTPLYGYCAATVRLYK